MDFTGWMDLSGKVFLAYLEEDQTARALFRTRPLLGPQGLVGQDDVDAMQDEGFLRIVPDRNEQHTFKERMRALGGFCLINLRDVEEGLAKVRQNKNYAPARGEHNKFVIYSDTLNPLPEALVFEVVSENRAPGCATPQYYLRRGGRIQGPFARDGGEAVGETQSIAPDSVRLFAVQLPDGQEMLFYWPQAQQPFAATPPAAQSEVQPAVPIPPAPDELSLPQAPHADIVQDTPAVKEQESGQPAPLTPMAYTNFVPGPDIANAEDHQPGAPQAEGKPHTPHSDGQAVAPRPTMARRAFNALHEVVDRQRRRTLDTNVQPSAPDAAVLSTQPDNPAENFKAALHEVWQAEDTRRQAVRFVAAMPDAARLLAQAQGHTQGNAVYDAMRAQLEDMEAERLRLLMQLESARRDDQAFRREAIAAATLEQKEELARLNRQVQQARQLLGEPQPGIMGDGRALLRQPAQALQNTLSRLGFEASLDEAAGLLLMAALMPQVGLRTQADADAAWAVRQLMPLWGPQGQAAADMPQPPTENDTAILSGASATHRADASQPGTETMVSAVRPEMEAASATDLLSQFNHNAAACAAITQANAAIPNLVAGSGAQPVADALPWVWLRAGSSWPQTASAPQPLGWDALRVGILQWQPQALPQAAIDLLNHMGAALSRAGQPLPLCLRQAVMRFLPYAAQALDGGVAAALEQAFCAWIIPWAQRQGVDKAQLRPLAGGMPRALERLA